jgi:hypothetical protein
MDDKVEWYTYSAIAQGGKGAFWTRDPNSEGSFELVQADPIVVVENDEHASGSGNRVLRRVSIRTGQGVAVDEQYFYAMYALKRMSAFSDRQSHGIDPQKTRCSGV